MSPADWRNFVECHPVRLATAPVRELTEREVVRAWREGHLTDEQYNAEQRRRARAARESAA